MAYKRVYVDGKNVERKRIDNSKRAYYEIKRNQLSVYWAGKKTTERVRPGNMYLICYGDGVPTIKLMLPPKRKKDIVMWLLGFPNELRAYTVTDRNRIIRRRRADRPRHVSKLEYTKSAQNWSFTWWHSHRDEDVGVAAYIGRSVDVDKAMAMEILRCCSDNICFPVEYLHKILSETFEMTPEEISQISSSSR